MPLLPHQLTERQIFETKKDMGYKFKTTFWTDFTVADHFGLEAVKDTYRCSFQDWKHDATYITELCLVLNWEIWEHYHARLLTRLSGLHDG